jgi:hypothetical protein
MNTAPLVLKIVLIPDRTRCPSCWNSGPRMVDGRPIHGPKDAVGDRWWGREFAGNGGPDNARGIRRHESLDCLGIGAAFSFTCFRPLYTGAGGNSISTPMTPSPEHPAWSGRPEGRSRRRSPVRSLHPRPLRDRRPPPIQTDAARWWWSPGPKPRPSARSRSPRAEGGQCAGARPAAPRNAARLLQPFPRGSTARNI